MLSWSWLLGLVVLLSIAVFLIVYPLRQAKWVAWATAIMVVFVASFSYWHWGQIAQWYDYQQKQARQQHVQTLLTQYGRNPNALIQQLKNRLRAEPNRAQGWYLLGRLYASQGLWPKAQKAFAKAVQLMPNHARYQMNYIESIWILNNRKFSDEIRQSLHDLLKKIPEQPDAMAMLAMDAYQNHHEAQAIEYWQKLLNRVSPGSEEAMALQKAVAQAQKRLND